MPALGVHHFALFLVSAVAITLLPGPAALYILGRSLSLGRRAGLLSVLGIGAGSACHIFAVAFGLSALLAASQTAFTVVKLAGSAYLIYLGIGLIRSRAAHGLPDPETSPSRVAGGSSIFAQGTVTQLLNPKAGLFFLAILPQFVTPAAGHAPLPFLVLGAAFVAIDTLWYSTLASFTAFAGDFLRRSRRVELALRRAAGSLYVVLGLALLRERMAVGR